LRRKIPPPQNTSGPVIKHGCSTASSRRRTKDLTFIFPTERERYCVPRSFFDHIHCHELSDKRSFSMTTDNLLGVLPRPMSMPGKSRIPSCSSSRSSIRNERQLHLHSVRPKLQVQPKHYRTNNIEPPPPPPQTLQPYIDTNYFPTGAGRRTNICFGKSVQRARFTRH